MDGTLRWMIGSWLSTPGISQVNPWMITTRYFQSGLFWIQCEVPDNQRAKCVYPLAHAIAGFIENNYELWLLRLLHRNFDYLSAEARLWILPRAMAALHKSTKKSARVDRISVAILSFVSEHNILVIEGMQDFLLKEFADDLNALLGRAADEYFLKREEDEYIQFLRRYSAWHHHSHLCVHVTYDNPSVYTNDDKTYSGCEYTPIFSREDYDDFIVANLVKTSPTQIVLQGVFPDALARLLRDIFPGRVHYDGRATLREQG